MYKKQAPFIKSVAIQMTAKLTFRGKLNKGQKCPLERPVLQVIIARRNERYPEGFFPFSAGLN